MKKKIIYERDEYKLQQSLLKHRKMQNIKFAKSIKDFQNKRKKEKELCEYQKLQYEQRKRQGLDDFIKLNEDAYNNMKRMEKENDDFITYAEGRIQEYKEQGKNVYPLLLELKKYRQKYG